METSCVEDCKPIALLSKLSPFFLKLFLPLRAEALSWEPSCPFQLAFLRENELVLFGLSSKDSFLPFEELLIWLPAANLKVLLLGLYSFDSVLFLYSGDLFLIVELCFSLLSVLR